MRWFCVAFGTLVVVSTALLRAGAPSPGGGGGFPQSVAVVVPLDATPSLPFGIVEMTNAPHLSQGAAWSAALLLGLPFLIRRRRERLS